MGGSLPHIEKFDHKESSYLTFKISTMGFPYLEHDSTTERKGDACVILASVVC